MLLILNLKTNYFRWNYNKNKKTIDSIELKYIKKEEYLKLLEEKNKLHKEKLEMENSFYSTTS